jgi:hypothetical protein
MGAFLAVTDLDMKVRLISFVEHLKLTSVGAMAERGF